jgi:hypothetical protein
MRRWFRTAHEMSHCAQYCSSKCANLLVQSNPVAQESMAMNFNLMVRWGEEGGIADVYQL